MCDYFLELMMWSSLMYLSLSMAEVSLASSCVLSLEPLMNKFWARTESVEYLLWKIKCMLRADLSWRCSPWPCYWSPSPGLSPTPRLQTERSRWGENIEIFFFLWHYGRGGRNMFWLSSYFWQLTDLGGKIYQFKWLFITLPWVILQSQLCGLGQMDSLPGPLEEDAVSFLGIDILKHRLQ